MRFKVPCPECGQESYAGFLGILRLMREPRSDECTVCHLRLKNKVGFFDRFKSVKLHRALRCRRCGEVVEMVSDGKTFIDACKKHSKTHENSAWNQLGF